VFWWGIDMANIGTMLHQGQVSERSLSSKPARVAFDDLNGLVSGKMQVLMPAVGGFNIFYTPEEGDHVVTIRNPNGQEEGYIVGTLYTANKMPQGAEKNIFLMISKNSKNFLRFNADKGTFELTVDQDGILKFNNLDIEVKELTNLKTKNLEAKVEEHTGLTTKELDIKSDTPIGFMGSGLQLGEDVLRKFWNNLMNAAGRNPIWIVPVKWPKFAPVPPVPILINMAIFAFMQDVISACVTAIADSKKVLQ